MKKMFSYVRFRLKNELRGMTNEGKLHLFFELFDMIVQPIFFGILFFVINPNTIQILLFSSFILFYQITDKLEKSYIFRKQDKMEKSFILLGMSRKAYRIGTDFIISLTGIIANIIYAASFVVISYLFYDSLFKIVLGIFSLQLVLLPVVYRIRYHLASYLKFPLIRLVVKSISFQNLTMLVLLLNLKHLRVSDHFILLGAVTFFLIILSLIIKKYFKNSTNLFKNYKVVKEFKIAIKESHFPISIMLFTSPLLPALAAYILYLSKKQITIEHYASVEQSMSLVFFFIPTMIIANTQVGLSQYYSFDIEGERMRTLRYLGKFIKHKIKIKIAIAYILSLLPYTLFLLYYWLVISDKGREAYIYLVAFLFSFALQPLFFFLGSLLFPNYKRNIFDINQRLSNKSTFLSITLCIVAGLAGYFYTWHSKEVISSEFFIMLVIDSLLLILTLLIIKNKSKEFSS